MANADQWANEITMEKTPNTHGACRVRPVSGILGLSGSGRIFGLWPQAVEVVILAAFSCFVAHLLRMGWEAKFGMVI